jgi:hypothetical protein
VECAEVSLLLSEYVDDELDPVTKGLVETHLTACTGCAAELRSLQAYLRAMAGMEKVGAPPNFLAAVHERLEHPSTLERIVRWLFYPLKIKIPMELAGIALATVLLVFTYQAPRRDKVQSLSEISSEIHQSALPAEMKGAALDKAVDDRAASTPRRIELTLLLPVPKTAQPELKRRPSATAPLSDGKLEAGRQKAHEQIPGQPSAVLEGASAAPMNAAKRDESPAPLDSQRAYELIQESVTSLRGTVLPAAPPTGTSERKTILVQIPARSYPRFLESLRRAGLLQKFLEKPAHTEQAAGAEEPLEIRIELIPAE